MGLGNFVQSFIHIQNAHPGCNSCGARAQERFGRPSFKVHASETRASRCSVFIGYLFYVVSLQDCSSGLSPVNTIRHKMGRSGPVDAPNIASVVAHYVGPSLLLFMLLTWPLAKSDHQWDAAVAARRSTETKVPRWVLLSILVSLVTTTFNGCDSSLLT